MTLETIITKLTNAGFTVDTIYPYIIVSLQNRAISAIEVALVLGVETKSLMSSNGSVLVKC